MPSRRAADEVRVVGELALRNADDELRRLGHDVNRSVRPINHLFRMTLAELHVVAGVARIGAGDGVASAPPGRPCRVSDRAGVAAVAAAFAAAVPRPGPPT